MRVRGRIQNPRRTPVRTKLRLKRFPRISPELRATWLSRTKKGCHFWAFSAYFPVFRAKKGRRKTRAQPWYARKSGKSLGQLCLLTVFVAQGPRRLSSATTTAVHTCVTYASSPSGSSGCRSQSSQRVFSSWKGSQICDPSRHLQESPGPPGPKSQKSLKKGLLGGLQKSPEKYPKKSKNTQKVWKSVFLDFFGYFSGLFCRPPKRPFLRLFCDFGLGGPGDSCK